MPQAPKKDNQTQRAQDKESKRARGALSCAECRRLKLKCDKTVPCSSCKRRGCSAICPNGSLITGQGTRFVLADTETLHQKIAHMSDRIRQLEDALAILQSTLAGHGGEPHPLLHRDLLKIKSSIELHSASGTGGEEHVEGGEEEEDDANTEYIDAFGTLAIRDDGAATFYGRSAGSESLLLGEVSTTASSSTYPTTPPNDRELSPPNGQISATPSYSDYHPSPHNSSYQVHEGYPQQSFNKDGALPNSIKHFASTFPLAPSLSADSSSAASVMSSPSSFTPSSLISSSRTPVKDVVTLQALTAKYLPPYVEALRLVQLYLEQAPWFFGAVTQRQLDQELLPLWYEEAAAAAPSSTTPPAGGLIVSTTPGSSTGTNVVPRTGTSHDLALLFIIFCFGALTDINLPSPPDNAPAENYYHLTKVALTLDPAAPNGVPDPKSTRNGILERPPSVATVQTLSLMAIYEGMCSGENSIETTWALMGLACKLSQSIGLHRDCARWKLTPAEVQKRRALFWELFITDCWQSLATGRLATFSLPFVDCELPADPDQKIAEDGSIQPSFPYWKARFGAECVSAVVQGTLTSRAPKYAIILDLDRKVRDMELPAYAQGPPPQGVGLAQTMSHFMPQNYRELTLLYIHRCFFAHAISSNPLDPIKSQYAPSFLAGYRSACTIVASVKLQFSMFPAQIARFWVLWTHAFSASVMLASVATHSPRSKIALASLVELKTACDLFEAASAHGGRAVKFLPILKRLQNKATAACRNANSGAPPPIPNDIFKPSQANDHKDELSIFSGKTHTMSTKVILSGAIGKSSSSAAPPRSSSKSSRSASDSPKAISEYPSFANVHPSLVSELSIFHGQIKTQIQNAYRNGGDLFNDGIPMVVDPSPSRALQVRQPPPPPPPQQQQQQQHLHYQQHQNHQQVMYQQAKMKQEQFDRQEGERLHMERMEQERQEAEQREIERLELERQEMELARQQHLQQQEIQRQQNHQHEVRRQQQIQQEAIQRQQHQEQIEIQQQQERFQQQQRQEQFRQQLEAQNQQQMSDYHSQTHQIPTQHRPSYTNAGPVAPVSTTHPPHSSHHHRRPSVEQTYAQQQQQQQQQHYQPEPHHHQLQKTQIMPSVTSSQQRVHHGPQHPIQPQHTNPAESVPQPQHSMYTIPPEYSQQSSHQINPEQMQTTPISTGTYNAPSTSYAPAGPVATAPPSGSYVPETYTYWPAAPSSFSMPDQMSTAPTYAAAPAHGYHHQQYTPENALRGIAAEDQRLQETWQSYMGKVGSPRQFLED